MKRKFFKRLRAGFSLVESLVAIAVLSLFSMAAVAVSTTVFGTKNSMMEAKECQTLASTALLTIADEIRYGKNVRVDSSVVVLDSANFGRNTKFTAENGRIVAASDSGDFPLMAEDFYGTLVFDDLTLTANGDFVEISVTVGNGQRELYSAKLTAEALNGVG